MLSQFLQIISSEDKLNALNIYNANMKIFTYGRKEQDKKILEDFRTYFLDECLKSDIMIDEKYYVEQMIKVFEEYEMKSQERPHRRRTVF